MAAEVPVSDVLCEAMEYLTKLGSNLRARSESLKEKRIRKDKLKNSHAVQKAADKVLLICELSKKSLENVEIGVRKVLSHMKDNQMSPAKTASSSKSHTTNKEKQYQYITLGSRKVKIAKKVPVKHYMSVRVLARNMPKSLQAKYPVYHDCKLYRKRKRLQKSLTSNSDIVDSKELIENKLVSRRNNDNTTLDTEKSANLLSEKVEANSENIVDTEFTRQSVQKTDNSGESNRNKDEEFNHDPATLEKKDKTELESSKTINEDKRTRKPKKKALKKFQHIKIIDDSSDNSSEPKVISIDSDEGSNKKKDNDAVTNSSSPVAKNNDNNLSEGLIKGNAETVSESLVQENAGDNSVENKVVPESSEPKVISVDSDEESNKKKGNDAEKKSRSPRAINNDSNLSEGLIKGNAETVSESLVQENAEDNSVENEVVPESSEPKVISVDSDEESNKKKDNDAEKKSRSPGAINNDSNSSEGFIKENAKTVSESLVQENAEDNLVENEEVPESNRPFIKCVSLNKLLKPDVLKKAEVTDNLEKSPDKKKEKFKKIKKVNSIDKYLKKKGRESIDKHKKNDEVSERNSSNDEEYWAMKRKEVSNFQSKKFTVKVYRLPTLNELFLKSHNLKKIIQNNKIICEFKSIASNSDKENNTISKESEIPIDKINSVKNDLLNESDSEKADSNGRSPVNFQDIMETVKSALLDFSVDEPHISELEGDKRIENVKDSVDKASNDKELACDSETSKQSDIVLRYDSESNISRKGKNNHDTEKETLPNECDIDMNEKILKSTQKDQDENEQSSIDKVKNTLLFDSGSDNNEQSNNATKKHNEKNNDDSTKSSKHEDNKSSNEQSNDKTSKPGENINDESAKSSKQEAHQSGTNEIKDKTNSDDQLETNCGKKRKRKNSTTVKSKRKHIMESMHAKKMLLTYSSSDTEDEQLKNALKDIKDSLLKEKSSDDENARNSKVKESSATSESDDDILRKVKRAKKSNKSDVSSSEEKNSKSTDVAKAPNSNNSDKAIESSDERSDSGSAKMGRSRAQPGGSSHNSDSQEANDKNIDGLTNLKSLSRRRRDSPATNSNSSSVKRTTRKMAKAPLLSEENLLKPDSSSDAASASGAESEVEDLPPVTLSGLNGSGLDHLAKDDLLDESDTSASHNEKEEEHKTTESEEDHNPKSKRRKAIAISSDSEAGSSRKIKQDERDSDFEESEDDGLEPSNRSKRKKKVESDASDASSSNDSSKKKRRRIKQINDSDASGSDTENEGRNKHGRKNIRKVMGKNQLEEATKKAAREEKERIARIAERQKVYNNLEFDESGKPDEVVLEKVVLDFDPETKEPLIEVDRGLVKKLKPHQANGIKFMWDACFESVKRIKKDRGSGCILAHCMGLGKTLQVVSLTHTLLTHSDLTTVNRVLVVCPLSTVLNWVNEYKMWLKHSLTDFEVDVYELSRYKQNSERAFQLQQWLQHGGVCVLGYEMFRNLSADNSKKFKKKMLKNFQEALVDPGPDLVVCDEGHLLKNEKTSLSQSMNRVRTRRRIVLTGTPLQNNLKEYYCMVQFVKPNLLGKYNEYLNRFVNPITNGQYTDSTEHDIRIMKRRSHVLHKMLDGAVQRRDYGVLAPFLPPKHEYVLFITLTEVQIKLYQYYLDNYSRRPLPGKSSGFLFPDFQSLQRIWTHPLVLKYNSERYEIMQQKKREREEEEDSEGSLVDFIDDDSTPDESTSDESSDDLSDASDDSRKKSKKKKSSKKNKPGKESKISTRRTRANPDTIELAEPEVDNDVVEMKAENPTEWWIKLVTDDEIEDMRNSHKLVLLFDILRQCETIGDKLLVFSQSLYSLDLIEHFLGKVDEATQEGRIDDKLGGHVGSWSPGIDYFRLDGSTSCENRSIWCKNFNREDNPRARLFLISTRAGGLGINLVAANRVVIFDVSWNPSHDVQSIFRVYRFGQKKPCYVYRFLAMGTMEEKIYERQVTKQAISKRVIDEQQIDRHYAENDLAELYKFEPRPPTPRPLPPLPKDRLFAEMLREHEAQIYKYHEHDSLLENKEEETLSEEERKAAWEDFENEKNRPPPAPFPTAWPMHNGMMPGLLAQQQQQLAYAALAAMLRKDMPNINDNTIRDMLPHIYNSNPAMFGGYDYGLMQKLSELYKFAPPGGMMNPGMMNPGVMNASGGGGGALGGSSGLQYEPPWQRQHQQQQQMRLQQLLQHQNAQQMGAKYYAGGLGSRDPVAMAMQQQRAREIMAGDTRSRPRGRPPLQPRAPPPPHADVVNLDSD